MTEQSDAALAAIALVEAINREDTDAFKALLRFQPLHLLTAVLARELAVSMSDGYGDQLPGVLAEVRRTIVTGERT